MDADPKLKFLTIAGELDQFVPPASSLEPFDESTRRVVAGNHVTMLDVDSPEDPSVKILVEALTGGGALAGSRSSAHVSRNRRVCAVGGYALACRRSHAAKTGSSGRCGFGHRTWKVGRSNDALDVLAAHVSKERTCKESCGPSETPLACHARRGGLSERCETVSTSLRASNQPAATRFRPGLLSRNQSRVSGTSARSEFWCRDSRARQLAQEVLNHCEKAQDPKQELWRLATKGDALTILDRWEEGLQKHREVMAKNPKPWQALSVEEQAIRTALLVGHSEDEVQELANIYEGQEQDK